MNNKPVYLTAEGLEKLKAELTHLITVERPRVAARIHDAKLDGDITENAEYEDAKQEQSFLEGRIGTLEAQLKNAEVIEKTNGDRVGIGSKVVIKGEDGQETFTIVGSAEAAPREGRISNESPVGAALMGHKKGDTVEPIWTWSVEWFSSMIVAFLMSASSAWIRPSTNACSFLASSYSAFSLRSPCSLASWIRWATSGRFTLTISSSSARSLSSPSLLM